MPALYEMVSEVQQLQEAILNAEGEMTPEIAAQLDALGDNINAKVDGICKLVAQLDGEAAMFKTEYDRLAKNASVRINSVKRLKEYLKTSMEALGETKIKTPLFGVTICKNGQPSVTVAEGTDLSMMPLQLTKLVTELDRAAVLERFKTNQPIPPEIVVTIGTHIRIK